MLRRSTASLTHARIERLLVPVWLSHAARNGRAARLFAILSSALAVVLATSAAAQDVEILSTDPAAGTVLTAGEPLYVRIRYDSDRPLRFGVRVASRGAEQSSGRRTSTSPVYPAGRGEALTWVEFVEPTEIDELRVRVYAEPWQHLFDVEQPLTLEWRSGTGASRRAPAAWVASLNTAQRQMTSSQMSASSSGSNVFWDLAILLMGWSVPGYFALQIYIYARWSGGWRTAGLLPLLLTVPILMYTGLALMAGSNLWPLIMLFTYPLAFLYLFALMIGKRLGIVAAS